MSASGERVTSIMSCFNSLFPAALKLTSLSISVIATARNDGKSPKSLSFSSDTETILPGFDIASRSLRNTL